MKDEGRRTARQRRRRAWRGLLGLSATLVVASACSLLTTLDAPTDDHGPSVDGSAPTTEAETSSGFGFDACGGPDACPDGPPPYYAAVYVAQSFPLATSALTMVEGQVIPSYIELKNTGDPWNSSTELGTTDPRNRTSLFADSTWLSGDRAAAVTGTVPTGSSFKFQFDLQAPQTPGTYNEHFGLVDGTVWFGDKDQGGPPDDDIQAQIIVVAPEYRGTPSAQSFPVAPATLAVTEGSVIKGSFSLTNTGTSTWTAGDVKIAALPRDKASPFYDSSWLSTTRIASVSANVAPGSLGTFNVKLDIPAAMDAGTYTVQFGLVDEGVTWFADPTLGGGPADGTLRVDLAVAPGDGG